MKYVFVMLCIVVFACKGKNELPIEDIKYSAYSWHLGKDSAEFYLAHYLDIDKNGHYQLMRHDTFMASPQYFTGYINDSILKRIAAIVHHKYSKTYFFGPGETIFYDGFYYCLDYKLQDTDKQVIQFILKRSPKEIQDLSASLDTLIYTTANNKAEPFSIDEYKSQLENAATISGTGIPKPLNTPPIEMKHK